MMTSAQDEYRKIALIKDDSDFIIFASPYVASRKKAARCLDSDSRALEPVRSERRLNSVETAVALTQL
jgi:hypothetical protein